jgi:hypothetical protein
MKNVNDISIEWNKDNAEVIVKLLQFLGYLVYKSTIYDTYNTQEWWKYIGGCRDVFCGTNYKRKKHFTNIEDFLKYHFSEEETEQQRTLRELQEKMEAHKATLKELEDQIKSLT